jgi:hypothetical protein
MREAKELTRSRAAVMFDEEIFKNASLTAKLKSAVGT